MHLVTTIRFILISSMLFFLEISTLSASGVGINATRIIFPQGSQSIPVTLRNSTEKDEYLVQIYVTKTAKSSTQESYFDVLPPMFYLAANKQRDVRLVETTKSMALPKDRESVFYLHARAIAGSEKNIGQDALQMKGEVKIAIENVIKVFYRPEGLTQTSDKAQASLNFSETTNGIKVSNPTPYYITLSSLKVGGRAISLSPDANNTMLAPFSEMLYSTSVKKGKITWSTINDLGGNSEYSKP
ncbi:molecular chaperone [Providencia heimbachae]|uniref:fimbrial biogenesis chaperone n=1 Tax=Providencia heimbachae TaxID=333962 RepID=UPI0010BF0C2F|nr:molecular chaperone [Providencia heimbachae]QCJ69374.1 molecular chaperone [Providencia heimbachae]